LLFVVVVVVEIGGEIGYCCLWRGGGGRLLFALKEGKCSFWAGGIVVAVWYGGCGCGGGCFFTGAEHHCAYDVKRAVLCCDALRISVVYPQLPATSSYLISMASLSVPIAARNSL